MKFLRKAIGSIGRRVGQFSGVVRRVGEFAGKAMKVAGEYAPQALDIASAASVALGQPEIAVGLQAAKKGVQLATSSKAQRIVGAVTKVAAAGEKIGNTVGKVG